MQLLSELLLSSDLPAMLALFVCGMIGWIGTKQVNRYIQRKVTTKQIQKKVTLSNDASELSLANPASQANAKPKSRRRSGRHAKADFKPTSVVEGSEVVECVRDGEESLQPSTPMASATADEYLNSATGLPTETVAPAATPEPEINGRVAKLLAKKAERKARKLQAQQEVQLQHEKQPELVATSETLEDECIAVDAAHAGSAVMCEIFQEPALQAIEERSHLQLYPECARDELVLDEQKGQGDMLAVDIVNSSEEVDTHASSANESSQSEQDSMSADGSSNFGESLWQCNKLESCSPKFQHMVSEQDGWMSSFEDLQADSANCLTRKQDVPAQTFVHLDDQHGSGVHFEPVHVGDGTQLYTDGQQLYAAVCVKVDDLVTDGAGFQHLPTDLTFQSLPTEPHFQQQLGDGTFQHLPSDKSSGAPAVDMLLSELAPYARTRFSSDGYEDECFQALPNYNNFEGAPIDGTYPSCQASDWAALSALQSDIGRPEFRDDVEDAAWNMCWDFTPSRWKAS